MLFSPGLFHRREAKPASWAVRDRVGKDDDDLADDPGALAEAIGPFGGDQALFDTGAAPPSKTGPLAQAVIVIRGGFPQGYLRLQGG